LLWLPYEIGQVIIFLPWFLILSVFLSFFPHLISAVADWMSTIAQLCQAISSQLRHLLTIQKKLVKQQYLLHMFPLAAEIGPVVWVTPANFNGFSRLCSVIARHSSIAHQANCGRRHLYSAGWPSCWASAHILVFVILLYILHIAVFILSTELLLC